MASKIFVLAVFLDNRDFHAFGQDVPAGYVHTFESSPRSHPVNPARHPLKVCASTSSDSAVSLPVVAGSYSATNLLRQLSSPSPSPACSSKRCAEPSRSKTNVYHNCVEIRWSRGGRPAFVIAASVNTSLSTRINGSGAAKERELELSPVV